MKRIFLDAETTGLAPGQIGQLSMIIDEDYKEIRAKNYFFKIDYITSGAEEVCGRGLDFYTEASNGKVFADYKDEIFEELKDATLIAHNLAFDENFISTEFWRQGIVFKPAGRFDTMEYFKDILKIPGKYGNKFKKPKLEELVNHFNIDTNKIQKYSKQLFNIDDLGSFHDAMYDTTAMFVAFQMYKESLYNGEEWKNTFSL